ncbi:MAG TPA: hypothetical protein VD903_19440 [Pseudonocardia sp.]|nr:hypothetical protein [Pseudonocardia sp.]
MDGPLAATGQVPVEVVSPWEFLEGCSPSLLGVHAGVQFMAYCTAPGSCPSSCPDEDPPGHGPPPTGIVVPCSP